MAAHRKKTSARSPVDILVNLVAVILVLFGSYSLGVPLVSTLVTNYGHQKTTFNYEELIRSTPHGEIVDHVHNAHEYNVRTRGAPVLDPWIYDTAASANDPGYQDYLSQLSAVDTMARLVIPAIDSDLPVYHGATDAVLSKGLGHLYGTSLPVGGESTHSVITGHTGMRNATMFDRLPELKHGDAIYLSTYGEKLKYQVTEIKVVLPHETDSLDVQEGRDLVTLITCTPYGLNTHRLFVTAERVEMDPDEVVPEVSVSVPTWAWIAGGTLLVALLIVISGIIRKIIVSRRTS